MMLFSFGKWPKLEYTKIVCFKKQNKLTTENSKIV